MTMPKVGSVVVVGWTDADPQVGIMCQDNHVLLTENLNFETIESEDEILEVLSEETNVLDGIRQGYLPRFSLNQFFSWDGTKTYGQNLRKMKLGYQRACRGR